jgi:hypothetical protein
MSEIWDRYAIYSYEQLQLKQPHVKVNGIYKTGFKYFIKCNNLELLPVNSKYQTIVDAFDKEIRVAGCSIELVTELPIGTNQIDERNSIDIINLSGNPLNISNFNKQLSLLFSNSFPKLCVTFNHSNQGWDVHVEREVSQHEANIIKSKINILCGYDADVSFKVGLNLKSEVNYREHDGLSIAVSRLSASDYSKPVMAKWEEDEQVWTDNKVKLFSADNISEKQKIQGRSACLLNSLNCEAHNIRNYLTLFSEVNIVVPPESKYEELLQSLDLNQAELLKLLEINRVKLIFPLSIHRYNKKLIENAVEINSANVMFSRELAYKTVSNLKHRNPILFLPRTIGEKKEILSELLQIASIAGQSKNCEWVYGLVNELSHAWGSMHEVLSIRGAMGSFFVGLGPMINTTIKALTGKDYFLEIMQAANSIEWAAANQAILCPIGPLAQNEINLAHLYSGVRQDWKCELVTKPNIATEEILTIASHVPVVELAEAFKGNEIDQFRKVLLDITNNKAPEELSNAIQVFNESVKRFEKNRKRLNTWDVQGISLDAALEISNLAIPFSGFIVKQLGNIINKLGDRYKYIDTILREVASKTNMTSPNVVLVSRMRNKVKDLL